METAMLTKESSIKNNMRHLKSITYFEFTDFLEDWHMSTHVR